MSEHPARTNLTYEDYLLLPEDGRQHEIIGGEHFVNAATSPRHQRVSQAIQFQLYRQVNETGIGEVFCAPIDVVLSPIDVVQPDLIVILRDRAGIVRDTRIAGAPNLLVEVLSPSTTDRDLRLKRKLYEGAGVPEYWVVAPDGLVLHQHALDTDGYRLAGIHGQRVESVAIPGVSVDLVPAWECAVR